MQEASKLPEPIKGQCNSKETPTLNNDTILEFDKNLDQVLHKLKLTWLNTNPYETFNVNCFTDRKSKRTTRLSTLVPN